MEETVLLQLENLDLLFMLTSNLRKKKDCAKGNGRMVDKDQSPSDRKEWQLV